MNEKAKYKILYLNKYNYLKLFGVVYYLFENKKKILARFYKRTNKKNRFTFVFKKLTLDLEILRW